MSLEPCRCGQPAVRRIAAIAHCHECAEVFLEPIRARHIVVNEGDIGTGKQAGPLRPDWGEQWAELACSICNATWTGLIGEPCTWCIERHATIIDAARQVILNPDLPDPDDPDHDRALERWLDQLAHAVRSGLVDEHQARQATRRQEGRHVA